jgi:hypothetical protein
MNTSKFRVTNFSSLLMLLLFATIFVTFNALTAQAQGSPLAHWTTAGSAGATEDESNPVRPTYNNNTASINTGTPLGNYILRYNVVAVDGLFNGANDTLTVRFRDPGPESRVLVQLKRANITAGGFEIVATFDSDLEPNAPAFTTSGPIPFVHVFDFNNFAYWLEVTLTRNTDIGVPSFALAKITTAP